METVAIPVDMFQRMSRALVSVEKYIRERQDMESVWVTEAQALELLGCKRAKLYQLKERGEIGYKAVGRRHQYSRKTIESYNRKVSL